MAKKNENSSALPAVGAGLAAGAAAGGGYALHRMAKNRRAAQTAQAAEEAARRAATASKLRKAKAIKGGKAVAGVAALAAGAEMLRRAAKNPKVQKSLANRRAAAAISRGASTTAKSRNAASSAARQFAETPGPRTVSARRVPGGPTAKTPVRSAASQRRHAQASSANVAKSRMRKMSAEISFEAFSDEYADILDKQASVRKLVGGTARAGRMLRRPEQALQPQDPLSRIGNWYVSRANKQAISKAKKAKRVKDMKQPVLDAMDKAFPPTQ